MMKIKIETLKKFVDKVILGDVNNKAIFNFSKEGLKVDLKNESNVLGLRGFLDKKEFEGYEEVGKLALVNLDNLKTMLGLFKEDVEIAFTEDEKKDKVEILFKGTNRYKHPITLLESLEDFNLEKGFSSIPFEEEIVMNIEPLKVSLTAGGKLKADSLTLNISGNKLTSLVGSANGSEFESYSELAKKVEKNYSFMLPQQIFKVINELTGEIKLKIAQDDNIPTVIENKTDDGSFIFVLSKRTD